MVQMNSSNILEENITTTSSLIREAAGRGADMVVTPEMTTLMEASQEALLSKVHVLEEDIAVKTFVAVAHELKIWLLIGSHPTLIHEGHKLANRSLLIDPTGNVIRTYDKIHMFDVTLPDGNSYQESSLYQAGNKAVIADLTWGKMGMSICYDVRFGHLYRYLAQQGAQIISVPSAFTKITGKAHWHTLLKARAIETGCYIVAPAQCGIHTDAKGNKRETYGHSLVVNPWGDILCDMGEDVGVKVIEIDLDDVDEVRMRIPSLQHERVFS